MELRTLRTSTVNEVSSTVDQAASGGGQVLLLFDCESNSLHNRFLREYSRTRKVADDFVVVIPGERAESIDSFFKEVRRAIPASGYMASNLDALADVIRVEGVAKDRRAQTYWIWRNSHILYAKDRAVFAETWQILAGCAREIRMGHADSSGKVVPPWPDWSPQSVVFLATGIWETMGDHASRPDSFLNRFSGDWGPMFPDLRTQLVVVRILRPD